MPRKPPFCHFSPNQDSTRRRRPSSGSNLLNSTPIPNPSCLPAEAIGPHPHAACHRHLGTRRSGLPARRLPFDRCDRPRFQPTSDRTPKGFPSGNPQRPAPAHWGLFAACGGRLNLLLSHVGWRPESGADALPRMLEPMGIHVPPGPNRGAKRLRLLQEHPQIHIAVDLTFLASPACSTLQQPDRRVSAMAGTFPLQLPCRLTVVYARRDTGLYTASVQRSRWSIIRVSLTRRNTGIFTVTRAKGFIRIIRHINLADGTSFAERRSKQSHS